MDWEASLKRDEFVDLVKAKLFEALHEKQMLESVAIEYDPRSFTLYVHNKAKDTALHPVPVELAQPHYAYNNHAAQPAERQALVAELVDEAKTRVAMQFWEVVRDRVYPLIRPTEFVDEWRRAHKDAKNKKHCVMVCSRLDDLEQLKVGYVVEQGDALAPVTLAVLEDWGVDLARLEATALENLRRLHRESAAHLSEKDFKKKEGIYEYMFRGDAYSAARILLREFPPLALDGDAVALLLNDNSVFVTGLRNAPAVARLRRMALFLPPTLAGSDYPSPKVLHLRDADGGRRWRALPAAVGGGPEAPRAVLCAQCQSAPGHSTCARCKVVYYCSAECQKRHWKTHKAVCKSAGR